MKRISIVAALTLMASVLVGLAGTPPAWAGTSTETTIFVNPASSYYGRAISLSGVVNDHGCISNCQHPQGHIDYYRATSAADFETTKVFLASSGSLGFDSDTSGSADPISYCCLPVGTWLIKGFYVPLTTGWDPSSDEADELHTVSQRPTTMSLTQSSTTSSFGQAVTFTATVTPFVDASAVGPLDPSATKMTGSVTFSEDPDANTHIQYGTVSINQSTGQASVSPSTLTVGTHHIKAVYGGDTNYQQSHDSVDHTVTRAASSNSLSASATSITYGDSVTFTDTVSPSAATGTVTFADQGGTIGTGSVAGASPNQTSTSTSSLPAGPRLVKATYAGDATYAGSTSNGVEVDVARADTTTALDASPDSSVFGQEATFTATVSGPGTIGGSVQFNDGSTDLSGLVTVSGGQAVFKTSTLSVGTHSVTAQYIEDFNHNGSTSDPVEYVVSKADTATALTSSASSSQVGQAVTFTATVSVVPPGGGTPTGSVQFKSGGHDLGAPKPLSGNTATLTLSTLGGGTQTISAVYSGDDEHNGSTGTVTHTVTCDNLVSASVDTVYVSGTTCLSNANVKGRILVPAGATLSIVNSTVRGGISTARGAGPITICGSHVIGRVRPTGAAGFVLIGDPDEGCAANRIDGSVTLAGNTGGFEVGFNRISNGLSAKGNIGAGPEPASPQIEGNTIIGVLACSGDSPVVSDNDRPNSVSSKRTGECVDPNF